MEAVSNLTILPQKCNKETNTNATGGCGGH